MTVCGWKRSWSRGREGPFRTLVSFPSASSVVGSKVSLWGSVEQVGGGRVYCGFVRWMLVDDDVAGVVWKM